jgi:hypothetical protein
MIRNGIMTRRVPEAYACAVRLRQNQRAIIEWHEARDLFICQRTHKGLWRQSKVYI